MRVLMVEDSAFNAFCLAQLLENICPGVEALIAKNSLDAIHFMDTSIPDLIVLDGNLEALDSNQCNGPALADFIWRQHPYMPIVAWTSHDEMVKKFKDVFFAHHKPFNDLTCWPKSLDYNRLLQAITALSLKYKLSFLSPNPESYHFQRLYA